MHCVSLRDPRRLGRARAARCRVLGVSPDSPRSHARFKDRFGLPFTLLADERHEVAELYGTWVEKQMYGKTFMGVERSTFVIDADGNVTKVLRRVKPDTHVDDVLAALPCYLPSRPGTDPTPFSARHWGKGTIEIRCG